MTVADSIKGQITRAKHIIRQQMTRIAELENEVERLRSAANAHDVLRSIYSDANQPTGHRLKAAGLALGVESAPLKPTEAPLDLTAEEVITPLADLVTARRKRQDELEGRPIEIVQDPSSPRGQRINLLTKPNGNGSDDSD
jgi:hypothetical protein